MVEDQQGEKRAVYGKSLLKMLSGNLNKEFGKGFSVDNLENSVSQTPLVSTAGLKLSEFSLSWSHYLVLLSIKEPGSLEKDPAQDACVKHKHYLRSMIRYILALSKASCSAGSSATLS
jgi:hypothetical protein